MTTVSFVFRFNISEVVWPRVESLIDSKEKLNFITANRIRKELFMMDTDISNTIKQFVYEGSVIPKEYWWAFWTSLIKHDAHNVYTTVVDDIEQFGEFEKHIDEAQISINKIVHLKVTDINKLLSLAKTKYKKIYDHPESLIDDILKYDARKEKLTTYARAKYNVTVGDFFNTKIEL